MNPWKTLNIEATDDKKVIKKAYATLIKQYKPDECPEKFQEIQAAYKMAINSLKKNITIQDVELSKNEAINYPNIEEGEVSISKSILEKIEKVAFTNLENPLNIRPWEFIKNFNNIYDIKLKEKTALQAFRLIANINLNNKNSKEQQLIPNKILKYMNNTFNWDEQWHNYQTIFSPAELEAVLSQVLSDEPAFLVEKTDIEGWFKCIATDTITSMFISYFWMFFSGGPVGFEFIKHAFYIFVGQRFVFEFFFNASMGKLSHNAFILNTQQQSASKVQIIIKHITMNLMAFPIYAYFFHRFLNFKILVFDQYIDYPIWSSVFGVMVALNLMTLILYKRFLHEFVARIVTFHKYPEEKPIFGN